MAHRKAESSTKNGRDSNPKYLGVKSNHGETVGVGQIIIRQRGTKVLAGRNVGRGKDDTLYALKSGKVAFSQKRITHFDNTIVVRKTASVK